MPVSSDGAGSAVLVMLAAGQATRYGGACKPLAPVGLHGEAVIDLNASDGLAAGFAELVVVLGPETGPAIAYHVEQCWPEAVPVSFAEQSVPLGTAHAALCAHKLVGNRPFAVVNSDDIYGVPALALLRQHLEQGVEHANVAFRLADTVVSAEPVTRGTCSVGPDGLLVEMVERRWVSRQPDGDFRSADGKEPQELSPDTLVSVNLWGLQPSVWAVLEAAVAAAHPEVGPDGALVSEPADDAEVLLPEVMGALAAGRAPGGGAPHSVRVLQGPGRCIGVTHPGDLPIVRSELAVMTGQGVRSERLWSKAD